MVIATGMLKILHTNIRTKKVQMLRDSLFSMQYVELTSKDFNHKELNKLGSSVIVHGYDIHCTHVCAQFIFLHSGQCVTMTFQAKREKMCT